MKRKSVIYIDKITQVCYNGCNKLAITNLCGTLTSMFWLYPQIIADFTCAF